MSPIFRTVPLLLFFSGCGDKGGDTGAADACTKPLAEAGASGVYPLGSLIQLDASGSDYCADYGKSDVTYTWSMEHVPTGSAVDDGSFSENRSPNAGETDFIPDAAGEYLVSLRVNDPINASAPDYVVVTITSDDSSPVADCGGDVLGSVGQATTMDGSSSNDPDGARVFYTWGLSSVPECSRLGTHSIFDQGTEAATVIPDCTGLYVMSLVVNDGMLESEPDYCTLSVSSDNQMPIAEAGADGFISPCGPNPLTLSGWASYDPEGEDLSYAWSVKTAPPGADSSAYGFDDASAVQPNFTWDQPGEWVFELRVADSIQSSVPDIVSYQVHQLEGNSAPTADAGEDIEVEVDTDCTWDVGGWTCEPCPETNQPLDGTLSTDPDGDPLNYEWSILDGEGDMVLSSTTHAVADAVFAERAMTYGSTYSETHELELRASDCQHDDTDRVTITYTCVAN